MPVAVVDAADKSPIDRETFDQVRRTVRALPAKYREPIVLKYLQQLSTAQISEILSISENAVGVRLNRARKQLN